MSKAVAQHFLSYVLKLSLKIILFCYSPSYYGQRLYFKAKTKAKDLKPKAKATALCLRSASRMRTSREHITAYNSLYVKPWSGLV